MLKKLLTSFRTESVRTLFGLYGVRTHYLVNKCLQESIIPTKLAEIKPTVVASRNYVKPRGGKGGKRVEVSEKELSEAFDIDELKEDFVGAVENFKVQLRKQSQPQSESDYIRNFEFEFDGKKHKIEDLAHVGKKSETLYVLLFDGVPKAIPDLVKTLRSRHTDWNVLLEGTKIHIQVPKKAKGDKPALKKAYRMHLSACKEELMIVQNKYMRKLNKQDALSLELKLKLQEQLNILTEELLKEAENYFKEKMLDLKKKEN